MYVVQYELLADVDLPLSNAPEDSVASLNTHDMFPFAAFLKGTDIAERERFGVLDGERAVRERQERAAAVRVLARSLGECGVPDNVEPRALLAAVLRFLGASPAQIVLVNLEDLWLEMEAQNLPGTRLEYPNWRRKARFRFEEFRNLPDVVNILAEVNDVRRTSKNHAKLR
jgi:4-alpha-glucanotransferase